MKKAKEKIAVVQPKVAGSFFEKGTGSFFSTSQEKPQPSFFNGFGNGGPASGKPVMKKEMMVQRQDEHPDETVTKGNETETGQLSPGNPSRLSPRMRKCSLHPEFPQVGCFANALKLDIDDNLWQNAWHFYQVANLHPGDDKLMTETFMRYGLGVNLLETTFGFLGVDGKLKTLLSYGTGIALKAKTFKDTGELTLDIPIPLGKDTRLDIQFDLKTDPSSPGKVEKVDTFVGFTKRY